MTTPTPPETNPNEPSYTHFACIGTGFSGIYLAATLARWHPSISGPSSIRIFSRDAELGGTWHVNRYPGAACDIPSALYSFSFAPNPDWTRVLPPAAELRAYLGGVADRYGVRDKIVFGVEVVRAEWVEARGRWRLSVRELKEGGGVFVHECRFLFSGAGQFTVPRELGVPGLERFRGEVMHSARWREGVRLEGKRVVVFGNGASASQIVPAILAKTKHLTQVIRSKHWVYPPIDKLIPDWIKVSLSSVPGLATAQRFMLFLVADAHWKGFILNEAGARYRAKAREAVEGYMRRTAPEKYHDMLIPDFEVGCKRRVFDSGYLESLHAENFTLTNEGVAEILPKGVRMRSGKVVEADVIVLATGFSTNRYLNGVEVIGRGGITLEKHWEAFGGPEAYHCTALSGFPNMFLILGPNSHNGHSSLTLALENSVNYSLRVLKPVLEGCASVASLKRSAEEAYVSRLQDGLKQTVWMSGCNSWYNRGPGGKVWNGMTYPWSQARYWYDSLFPVWRDWEYAGGPSTPIIANRRRVGFWFFNLAVLVAGGLFAWVKRHPESSLASMILLQRAALSQLVAWTLGLLPKLH